MFRGCGPVLFKRLTSLYTMDNVSETCPGSAQLKKPAPDLVTISFCTVSSQIQSKPTKVPMMSAWTALHVHTPLSPKKTTPAKIDDPDCDPADIHQKKNKSIFFV